MYDGVLCCFEGRWKVIPISPALFDEGGLFTTSGSFRRYLTCDFALCMIVSRAMLP
jgi:hypothetical protein